MSQENRAPLTALDPGMGCFTSWHVCNLIARGKCDGKREERRQQPNKSGGGGGGLITHLCEKSATPQIHQQAEGRGAVETEWVVTYHARNPLNDQPASGAVTRAGLLETRILGVKATPPASTGCLLAPSCEACIIKP